MPTTSESNFPILTMCRWIWDCRIRCPIEMPRTTPRRHWCRKWHAKYIRDMATSVNRLIKMFQVQYFTVVLAVRYQGIVCSASCIATNRTVANSIECPDGLPGDVSHVKYVCRRIGRVDMVYAFVSITHQYGRSSAMSLRSKKYGQKKNANYSILYPDASLAWMDLGNSTDHFSR